MVTVVFADLAGFTALAEGRDPETAKEVLDEIFGVLAPVVVANGGHVDKTIGDELMAVFGAPVAHEDDPERAVRAALGLAAALDDLGDGVHGIGRLALRVGINTGEVMTGPVGPSGAPTVTGDSVNTAHRLVSAAGAGEILVGETTWAATSHVVDYEPRPAFRFRGKTQPVRAWAVHGARGVPGARPRPWRVVPLVGRGPEMDLIGAVARNAFRERRLAAVTLTGEAGAGKTRLAVELQSSLCLDQPDALVLWGRCPPYGASGVLWPVAELLRTAFGIDAAEPRTSVLDKVERGLARLPVDPRADGAVLATGVAQLLGLDPLPERPTDPEAGPSRRRLVDELMAAATTVLEALAASQPTVIVLDDLHWADDVLLDFVDRLAARPTRVPLLMLVLARTELLERRTGWGGGWRWGATIALEPLDEPAAIALLRALLGGGDLSPVASRHVLEAAGGNPFFLEETVRLLAETGALKFADGHWQAQADLVDVGLPAGARAVVAARLDRLSPAERSFLLDAAVVGRSFGVETVDALGPHAEPHELVARLVERQLLDAPADAGGELSFRHVLTREVAYAAVPLGERAEKHARAAAWFEHHAGEHRHEVTGLLAYHFGQAASLGHQLDHTDPGLSQRAFEVLADAGRQARRRDSLQDAERWLGQARSLPARNLGDHLQVALEHGQVLTSLRRIDDALAVLGAVSEQAEAMGRDRLAAAALAWRGEAIRWAGDVATSNRLLEEARDRWRAIGDAGGEAEVLRLQAGADLFGGRTKDAMPRLLHALELERRVGDRESEAWTLQHLGWCYYLMGDVDLAGPYLYEAAQRFGESGDTAGVGWCFGVLGLSFYEDGRLTQAREVAENLRALARGRGDPWGEGICAVLMALCDTEAGDLDAGRALAEEAARTFGDLGDAWGGAMVSLVLARLAHDRGDGGAAREELGRARDIARRISDTGIEVRVLAELAALEHELGETDDAERHARAVLSLRRSGVGGHGAEVQALTVLARLAIDQGDRPAARLLLEEAVRLKEHAAPTTAWRVANAELARLLAAAGDRDAALRHAALAAEGADEVPRVAALARQARAAAAATPVAEGGT